MNRDGEASARKLWNRSGSAEIGPELILAELHSVLTSRHFRMSKRSMQFLRFVVEQTIQGNAELIKERLIGAEVFGRLPDYSTGEDPVVRVQAGEVRRRLELYGADPEVRSVVQIELPPGSYVPVFRLLNELTSAPDGPRQPQASAGPLQDDPQTGPSPEREGSSDLLALTSVGQPGRDADVPIAQPHEHASAAPGSSASASRWWFTGLALLLFALSSGVLFKLYQANTAQPDLKRFWMPATSSVKPVLLCVASPLVYRPSASLFERYAKERPGTFQTTLERQNKRLPLAPDTLIRWGDMVPLENSGPAIGGVIASLNLSRMLTEQGTSFEVRFGQEASFTEFRTSPAVIVGALNTEWTTHLTSGLPFVFKDTDGRLSIAERNGAKRIWGLESGTHRELTRDYGLITRQAVSKTGQFLVQIAGISDRGTEAASEVITTQHALAQVSRSLPRGWEQRNIQILVSTDISEGIAGPPHLVAFSTW